MVTPRKDRDAVCSGFQNGQTSALGLAGQDDQRREVVELGHAQRTFVARAKQWLVKRTEEQRQIDPVAVRRIELGCQALEFAYDFLEIGVVAGRNGSGDEQRDLLLRVASKRSVERAVFEQQSDELEVHLDPFSG